MSIKQQALEELRRKNTSNNTRKASLEVSLAVKQQCEAKALKVVLSLIETSVSEDYLKGVRKFIRRSHYQDVTEERALDKLCGYPLCDNSLKKISAQKYHISAKSNKVYDISERKNFCCNQCFKCSKYLEEQLLTTPLWLEDEADNEDQPLKLLSVDVDRGIIGIEVDFGKLSLKPEAEELRMLDDSGPQSVVCESRVAGDDSGSSLPTFSSKEIRPLSPTFANTDNQRENARADTTRVDQLENKLDVTLSHARNAASLENTKVVQKSQGEMVNKNVHYAKEEKVKSFSNPFDVVEKRVVEWFTINSAIFILGDQKFQEVLKNSERQSGMIHNAERALQFQQHYTTLCRKLDLEEVRDRKADESLVHDHDSDDEKVPAKPLPTLEELQETELQLKVLAFYKGYLEPPANAQKEVKEETKKVKFKRRTSRNDPKAKAETQQKATSSLDSAEALQFPLLDTLSQTALRRRIVLDRLNNACSELLDVLGLTRIDVASGLRKLVQTLRLDAQNITLKPAEWPFVVIVFLKLLAVRDSKLQHALDSKTSLLFLETLFKGLNKSISCVHTLVDRLLDVTFLLNK